MKYAVPQKLINLFTKVASMNDLHARYLHRDMLDFSNLVGRVPLVIDIGGGKLPYNSTFFSDLYVSLDIEKRDENLDVLGDICHLPFKDCSVDLILCTEVIEHVSDTLLAFQELKRVVKSDGHIIITIPFMIGQHDTVDYYRFTSKGLEKLLTDTGLEIVKINKRGGIFSCIGSMLTAIPLNFVHKDDINSLLYCFIFAYFLLLLPVMKILMLLDTLDHRQDYTLGYNLLLKSNRNSACAVT